jgi:hypothetical protein
VADPAELVPGTVALSAGGSANCVCRRLDGRAVTLSCESVIPGLEVTFPDGPGPAEAVRVLVSRTAGAKHTMSAPTRITLLARSGNDDVPVTVTVAPNTEE